MAQLEAYYDAVIERAGYTSADGLDTGPLTTPAVRRRVAAVDDRTAVTAALDRSTLVATGIGMTGPPHLGSIAQMRTAIALQEVGFDVQFVLADLEVYHGGGDRERLQALARRYRSLLLGLGFDPEQGRLRTQSEAHAVMATGHRLARYYDPADEDGSDSDGAEAADEPATNKGADGDATAELAFDRALRAAYEAAPDPERPGPTSAAGDHHSAVLHLADFLHPLSRHGYEQVLIALGIEERGLTAWTRRHRERAGIDGVVAGLHTRLIGGFGAPKMSKRIPGSDVNLAMPAETIRDRLTGEAVDAARPEASIAFQAMRLAGPYTTAELERRRTACREGGSAWERAKATFADHVVDLAERW